MSGFCQEPRAPTLSRGHQATGPSKHHPQSRIFLRETMSSCPASPTELRQTRSYRVSRIHHRAWEACRGLTFLGPPSFNCTRLLADLTVASLPRALVQKPAPMSHPLSSFQGRDDLFYCTLSCPISTPASSSDHRQHTLLLLGTSLPCGPGKAPFL